MSNRYNDIIERPRPVMKHERMPLANRAAQFAPFSALNTLSESISETARTTSPQLELSADELNRLSRRLHSALKYRLPVKVTYFQPDTLKSGGAYHIARGLISKVDEIDHTLIIPGHKPIPLRFITNIQATSD